MTDFVELTRDPLDVGALSSLVAADSTGAVSIFAGTTRNNFEGKKVTRLEYEAYEPMARKVMLGLCTEIRKRWKGVLNVAVYHRLGPVGLREASVVIAVSSEHRRDSLDAVSFAIDELKATVPIWKKEVYSGRSAPQWKENKECKWSNKDGRGGESKVGDEEEEEEEDEVDPSMIQITASSEEISRRMESFMERKREELDRNNVLEFCNRAPEDEEEEKEEAAGFSSCARVDSALPTGGERSSHIRQSQVVNSSGPQTSDYMDRRHDPLEHSMKRVVGGREKEEKMEEGDDGGGSRLPSGISERVTELEAKLGEGKPVPKDVYQRLKALEDRVRYLEGMSPEYFDLLAQRKSGEDRNDDDAASKTSEAVQNSLTSINTRIQELQKTLKSKPIKKES